MNLFSKKDAQLIKGCVGNDRSAQEGLYKLYYRDMLLLCNRYLKSEELSKEAVNAGFLKVFQHIKSFDEKQGTFSGWIKVIMIRTCLDLVRKEASFHSVISSINPEEDVFVSPDVLEKLYAEDLIKTIRILPAATQLVFNLSVIDGYSHREISEKLNITEGTSRWHLAEAKKQLRNFLEPNLTINKEPTEINNKIR